MSFSFYQSRLKHDATIVLARHSGFQADYSLKVRKQKLRIGGVIEIQCNNPVHARITLYSVGLNSCDLEAL